MNDNSYLEIARTVAKNSKCLKRQYGAIIVKNDEIIATGYNGPPRGCTHCTKCARDGIASNTGDYQECESVHAEQNCIIQASRKDMMGSTLYLVGFENGNELETVEPCNICNRLIKNAGIMEIITPMTITSVYQHITTYYQDGKAVCQVAEPSTIKRGNSK